jgi:hypothetical protein
MNLFLLILSNQNFIKMATAVGEIGNLGSTEPPIESKLFGNTTFQ